MPNLTNKQQGYIAGRFGSEGFDVAKKMGLVKELSDEKKTFGILEYKRQDTEDDSKLPEVTCVCPTYGRFKLLRRAIACFLLQDYPNKSMIICNDAPVDINEQCLPGNIKIINRKRRFKTVGQKRHFLLEQAETPLVAHWDDDDIYMPWHLLHSIRILVENNQSRHIGLVSCKEHWMAAWDGDRKKFIKKEWRAEAGFVFYRGKALEYGGYPDIDGGQAAHLMRAFIERRELATFDIWPFLTLVYGRGEEEFSHLHSTSNREKFARENTDYGNFEFLIPGYNDPVEWAVKEMSEFWIDFLDGAKNSMSESEFLKLRGLFKTRRAF